MSLVPFLLCLSVCVSVCWTQQEFRLFPANYKLCSGSARGLMEINSVLISAPLARKDNCLNKHLLVKGRRVQICVNGTIPQDLDLPLPFRGNAGFKNSAHGTLPAIPPQDFCEIQRNGCENANPPCSELVAGSTVELCSVLRVPDDPILLNALIQPDVLVRWRTMYEFNYESECEKRYDAVQGQIPFICIDLDSKVVNSPQCPTPLFTGK